VETLDFSTLERQIYDQVYHNAKSTFKTLDAKGAIGKNWHSIFALLMRFELCYLLLLLLTPFSDCAELFYIPL